MSESDDKRKPEVTPNNKAMLTPANKSMVPADPDSDRGRLETAKGKRRGSKIASQRRTASPRPPDSNENTGAGET